MQEVISNPGSQKDLAYMEKVERLISPALQPRFARQQGEPSLDKIGRALHRYAAF